MTSPIYQQAMAIPRPSTQRAPSVTDDSVFLFDSEMSTSIGTRPGSLISDRGDNQLHFGSLMAIDENSHTASYPPLYNPLQQQARVDIQPASFQFTTFAPSNTMPANNHTSLLSLHFKEHAPAYGQSYGTAVATSPIINQPSFPHSVGHVPLSQMHPFVGQDQYPPLKFDEDWDLQLLSPGPEITSPVSDWPIDQGQAQIAIDKGQAHATVDQGQVQTAPIGIPSTNKPHWRGASFGNNSIRAHPYRSPSHGGSGDGIFSPGTSFMENFAKQFAPHQQQAALNILNYNQIHPDTAIPASLITAELAEVLEGRGWCLLGNCGVDRANQKLNPHYDIHKDASRKRLDHLYDHIRDKHFNCRPFRCSITPCVQTFSREHDLKRHEKTHTAVSLPCELCGKNYTRDDNLKRHVQLKHLSLPQTSRRPSGTFPF